MGRGGWWAAVHGVAKSRARLKRLHFHFSLSCIGEGNGNPLQCPCLENPRDGRARWAAVYGVAQSRTRLKWLSSSSTSFPWRSAICALISFQVLIQMSLWVRLSPITLFKTGPPPRPTPTTPWPSSLVNSSLEHFSFPNKYFTLFSTSSLLECELPEGKVFKCGWLLYPQHPECLTQQMLSK